MTIAPPSNTYPSRTNHTLSPGQKADKREDEARYAAYLATPEGQAEVAAKARQNEESWKRLEAFLKLGETDGNDGEGGPKSKKHGKKGTGGLLGLFSKWTKKG